VEANLFFLKIVKKILAKNSKLGALVIGVITLSFLFISLTIFSQGVFAVDTGLEATRQAAELPDNPNIMSILGQIIYIILSLLGVVFIILVIYGGFMRMTAGGKSDQIEKSTKIITSAVIGVIIILASYAITAFVLSRVGASVGNSEIESINLDENPISDELRGGPVEPTNPMPVGTINNECSFFGGSCHEIGEEYTMNTCPSRTRSGGRMNCNAGEICCIPY
jgi:hypothetical protein